MFQHIITDAEGITFDPDGRFPVRIGRLGKASVYAVLMDRRVFLDTIDKTLTKYDPKLQPAMRDEIWPVAETMTHFPFGTWMDAHRGCGCIVGEYLVAGGIIDRDQFATNPGYTSVHALLNNRHGRDLGGALEDFGNDIDQKLKNLINADFKFVDLIQPQPNVIIFDEDTARAAHAAFVEWRDEVMMSEVFARLLDARDPDHGPAYVTIKKVVESSCDLTSHEQVRLAADIYMLAERSDTFPAPA